MDIFLLVIGFVLLIFGSNFLVDGASSLAKNFKIPPIVIGLTVVAFGTSSPELIVNVYSSIKGNSEMTFGNVIGSNVFNISVILGICAIIKPNNCKKKYPLVRNTF